jgi:DNA-directed RNA polymerase specialized sigma24 family protein
VADVPESEFEAFFAEVEPRLRRALVAGLGGGRGREATAEAMGWAWENWDRVRSMVNPAGYLYRVGRSRTRYRRRPVVFAVPADASAPWVEPALVPALVALSEQQRVVVVLVHGYGWSQREVADMLGVAASTVQTHLERALGRLRAALEVCTDA